MYINAAILYLLKIKIKGNAKEYCKERTSNSKAKLTQISKFVNIEQANEQEVIHNEIKSIK